jgi:hypothetical protein
MQVKTELALSINMCNQNKNLTKKFFFEKLLAK